MTTVNLSALKIELKTLLVSVANLPGVTPESIGDDVSLFHDGLGLDSIDLLELVVNLDKKYGLKLQNNDAGRAALKNIECLSQTLGAHLSGAAT